MDNEFYKATLTLFNALVIEENVPKVQNIQSFFVDKGCYICDIDHLSMSQYSFLMQPNKDTLTGEQLNSTFHKSWNKIADVSTRQLVLEQIMHYISVSLHDIAGTGIYIPQEILNVPELTEPLHVTVVNMISFADLMNKVINLTSLALSNRVLDDLVIILKELPVDYHNSIINSVKNNELKIRLYVLYGMAPTNPVEWLRYVIYRLTGSSVIINNTETIQTLRASDGVLLDTLILTAPDGLGSIFLRYKNLFLAMKKASSNKNFFNQLRKKANTEHTPAPVDCLRNLTNDIRNETINFNNIVKALNDTSMVRSIQLLEMLHHLKININGDWVYRVRNGKLYWKKHNNDITTYTDSMVNSINNIINYLHVRLINYLAENRKVEYVVIPNGVNYTLPTSEKNFLGNFPLGTNFSIPEMKENHHPILGIHWYNHDILDFRNRVDLDLSMCGIDGVKIGWDGFLRDAGILFSGDNTNAPRPIGAAEAFMITRTLDQPYILKCNVYPTGASVQTPIETSFFISSLDEDAFQLRKNNYTIDPNNLLFQIPVADVVDGEINLGMYYDNVFYIIPGVTGANKTSRVNERDKILFNYQMNKIKVYDKLNLKDCLIESGYNIVQSLSDIPADTPYIDLTPSVLSKTSILDLFV